MVVQGPKAAWLFQIPYLKAIAVSLPWLVLSSLLGMCEVYLLKTHLFAAMVMGTPGVGPYDGTGPTLAGPHVLAPCPHCGDRLILRYDERLERVGPGPVPEEIAVRGICRKCLRVAPGKTWDPPDYRGDRFLVNKLLTPRRWNVIVFHGVPDPFSNPVMHFPEYVRRVVGLPGEVSGQQGKRHLDQWWVMSYAFSGTVPGRSGHFQGR